jgi:chemotaxis protein CheD
MGPTRASDIFLSAGEYHFGGGAVRVRTLLGTCVAIVIWHPLKRIGGICHYLLPKRGAALKPLGEWQGLYADDAMKRFDESLSASRTQPSEYVAKVFGGGNMFPGQMLGSGCPDKPCTEIAHASCRNIGCQNVRVARTLLAAGGFRIVRQDVGGIGSRQLVFDLRSGRVSLTRGAAMPGNVQAVTLGRRGAALG